MVKEFPSNRRYLRRGEQLVKAKSQISEGLWKEEGERKQEGEKWKGKDKDWNLDIQGYKKEEGYPDTEKPINH